LATPVVLNAADGAVPFIISW